MQAKGFDPRPSTLLKQFNSRFRGRSITFQTASRWLNGQALPKADKLIVLADWLGMDRGRLNFGEKETRRGSDKQAKDIAETCNADEQLLYASHDLPDAQRKLVRELITLLATTARKHRD